MALEDKKSAALTRPHVLQMDNREKLRISGVKDVSGFDETGVILATDMGELAIRGEELHIEKIDLDAGLLELRGKISELCYEERLTRSTLWARLFG